MPFVKDEFFIKEPIPAFVMLMQKYGITQSEAQRIIDRGRILVDGQRLADKAVEISGFTEVVIFRAIAKGIEPIFKTPDFMVFDKPSGVLVHPRKMDTPHSMLDEVRYYGGKKANSTHRIDKETSGLLLASIHKDAEKFLKCAFETKDIQKSYRAWVRGRIDNEFVVKESIIVNDDYSNIKHKVFINNQGKVAQTEYKPILYNSEYDATLLECIPYTGRTHQIRVHLFHVKHPILGDPLYGTSYEIAEAYLEQRLSQEERLRYTGAKRLMLHAYSLSFEYKNRFFLTSRDDFNSCNDLALKSIRDNNIYDGYKKITNIMQI